jgi:hypothetical protein
VRPFFLSLFLYHAQVDFEDGDSLDGIPEYNVYTEAHFKRHFGRDPPRPPKSYKPPPSDESDADDSDAKPISAATVPRRSSGASIPGSVKNAVATAAASTTEASPRHTLMVKSKSPTNSQASSISRKADDVLDLTSLPLYKELSGLEVRKCGSCRMCRKSGCGRCYSCVKNKKNNSASSLKMACLRTVSYHRLDAVLIFVVLCS